MAREMPSRPDSRSAVSCGSVRQTPEGCTRWPRSRWPRCRRRTRMSGGKTTARRRAGRPGSGLRMPTSCEMTTASNSSGKSSRGELPDPLEFDSRQAGGSRPPGDPAACHTSPGPSGRPRHVRRSKPGAGTWLLSARMSRAARVSSNSSAVQSPRSRARPGCRRHRAGRRRRPGGSAWRRCSGPSRCPRDHPGLHDPAKRIGEDACPVDDITAAAAEALITHQRS